ncbi:Coiled-coil domain-containing protein 33 [Podochytrium sp. JEL0797]|nr:Coiled-coil domain-containing protein 33 [Podochytrium sp. JEL0797]
MLQREYSSKMLILECFLRGIVVKELPFAARCIAALKIVHNSSEYVAKLGLLQKRLEEGCPTTFPRLAPLSQLDFDTNGTLISDYPLIKDAMAPHSIFDKAPANPTKRKNNEAAYYQMTLSSEHTTKPEWNESFVFFIDMLSFNAETSLVIELYRDPPLNGTRPLHPGDSSSNLPIDDLLGYAIVPLGDFSVIPLTETRSVVKLDKTAIHFLGQYSQSMRNSDTFVSLDIRVPENWNQINPDSLKPKPTAVSRPEKRQASTFRGSFEQILELVKLERESDLMAAAAAEENVADKEITLKSSDITHRQKLIDRLLLELENRTQSIQTLGLDLVAQKERARTLESKIEHLESKLLTQNLKTAQILNTMDLQDVPHAELVRRYGVMAERLQAEVGAVKHMSQRLEAANLVLMERNDFEKRYLEMREAHMGQQNLLQKLQREQDAVGHLKETIKKQEQVITRLGGYLKERMPPHMQGKIDDMISSKEPQEVEINLHKMLVDENAALKKQIQHLEERNADRGTTNNTDTPHPDSVSQDTYLDALLRAESNETRIIALESELATNAREFAKKLAELQRKLLVMPSRESGSWNPALGVLKDRGGGGDRGREWGKEKQRMGSGNGGVREYQKSEARNTGVSNRAGGGGVSYRNTTRLNESDDSNSEEAPPPRVPAQRTTRPNREAETTGLYQFRTTPRSTSRGGPVNPNLARDAPRAYRSSYESKVPEIRIDSPHEKQDAIANRSSTSTHPRISTKKLSSMFKQ